MKTLFIIIIFAFSFNLSFAQQYQNRKEYLKENKKWENSLTDMIMLEGSYNRYLGEFGEVYNKSTGVYINYGNDIFKSSHVIFRTGYTDFNVKDESTKDSTSFKAIPVQAGIRYYVTTGRIMPFFSFIAGVNIISQDKNIDGSDNEQTIVRFCWQPSFGISFKIAKPLNLELSAKYNDNFYNPDAMMTSFEYSGGLSFNFGK